jgi:protein-L-isoaspartate(D-aspartate) O-methyltransferase
VTTDPRKIQLIMALRNQGVRDMRVLEAIEKVPREIFVNDTFADQAYADQALPIACGQTISQPFIVGFMTDRLQVNERHKVLEIGTGSGYQTAILNALGASTRSSATGRWPEAKRVSSSSSSPTSRNRWPTAAGWPKQAPFERIIVTAAAKQVPQALLDQLAVGGIMIVPVEEKPGKQNLYRITRGETGYDREHLLPVRFVPLVEGVAKEM